MRKLHAPSWRGVRRTADAHSPVDVHGLSLFTAGPMWPAWHVGDELLTIVKPARVHGKLTPALNTAAPSRGLA